MGAALTLVMRVETRAMGAAATKGERTEVIVRAIMVV